MQPDNVYPLRAGRVELEKYRSVSACRADATGGPEDTCAANPEGIYLGPEKDFPAKLTELPLAQVQVLHSRLERQLDWELRCDPEGLHPMTQDRHHDLVTELDARRIFLSHHHACLYDEGRDA